MRRSRRLSTIPATALAAAAGLALAPPALAEEPAIQAELACQPLPAPGRVLCELELAARHGRLSWGDALVVQSPEFARPLRARVRAERPSGSDTALELPLAFVATRTGRAPVEVLARAVVCGGSSQGTNGEDCRPELALVRAEIAVGAGL